MQVRGKDALLPDADAVDAVRRRGGYRVHARGMARIAGQLQPHRQVLAGLVQPQAGAVDGFEPERLDDGRLGHDSGNAEVTPLLARAFASLGRASCGERWWPAGEDPGGA